MRTLAASIYLCFAAAATTVASSVALAAEAAPLVVESAWIRSPPPGTDVAAAYFTLRNTGTTPVSVVGVETSIAMHAMLHETRIEGGQARMRASGQLLVPPGQTVALTPGAVHVMLHGVNRALAIGESVPLVLLLSDGSKLTVNAVVRSATGE